MNNKNTLIILSPGFPANEKDSTCLPAQQVFVKALNKNFPSLRIIILAFQYPRFVKEYKWFGNDVISFNGGNKGKFSRLLLWWHVYRTLVKLNRQNNIVGVLSFWVTECALIGKFFSKKHRLKHYCWILGQDARSTNKYVKWIDPKPTELVALSQFLVQQFYTNHGIKPAHVIINGIEPSMFTAMPAIRSIDIIGVGSLSTLKQYDMFVEIIVELKNYFPSIRTMLCGDGEDAAHIRKMISDLSLEKNIEMAGMLQHTEAIQKMQRAKILMHPSSYEGFSTVCLEALYAGAHVISFIKPMNHAIKHWHIVQTKEEMFQMALSLLQNEELSQESILLQSMDDTAKEIMQLFRYADY